MNNIFTSNDKLYKTITELLIKHNLTISTMGSCTSALIATLLTNTECDSLKGAFVICSNEAIMKDVSKECIDKNGIYSVETALEMARVCKKDYKSNIDIGII